MNPEPHLDEKIVLIHQGLEDEGIAHAFGGALALAYYAEPRATIDIDINVFVPPRRAGRVFDLLARLGGTVDRGALLARARRDGQARVRWGRSPIDLFFSYDAFHDACAARRQMVPFGAAQIPILSPEHLVVCKAVFDRRKDWIDIEQVLFGTAASLNLAEALDWADRIVGATDRRAVKLRRTSERILGRSRD